MQDIFVIISFTDIKYELLMLTALNKCEIQEKVNELITIKKTGDSNNHTFVISSREMVPLIDLKTIKEPVKRQHPVLRRGKKHNYSSNVTNKMLKNIKL